MKHFFLILLASVWGHMPSWGSTPDNLIESDFTYDKIGETITRFHYNTVTSTQKVAENHLSQEDWVVVTADSQSAGYGLWKRPWISPPGNIFSTFCIPFHISYMDIASWVPPFAALAVFDTLSHLGIQNEDIGLRWVNTVLVEGKKIAGVLIEPFIQSNKVIFKIGIGINVDMSDEALQAIDQPAISLRKYFGVTLNQDDVLSVLTRSLKKRFNDFKNKKAPVCDYLSKLLYLKETLRIFGGREAVIRSLPRINNDS